MSRTLPAPARGDAAFRAAPGVRRGGAAADPLESVPMRLTYRTSRVLEGVAELRAGVRIRVTARSGISRGSRIRGRSRSCCGAWSAWGCWRTAALGHAKGEPNAWRLTAQGELVARSIRAHSRFESEAA